MVEAASRSRRTINYQQAQSLVLLLGLAALAIVAVVMYVRRVDPAEVSATLFFLPVFMGFLFWGLRGGLILGVLATAAYIFVRLPAIELLGWSEMLGLVVTRATGYMAFGLIGGWATEQLKASITKLDLYDQIDDETGLFNSRSFIETVDLERSRAARYEKLFSVVTAESLLNRDLGRRRRRSILRDLGSRIGRSIRSVDHAAHAEEGDTTLFGFVLPETSHEGASTFADKLRLQLATALTDLGIATDAEDVRTTIASYPGDEPAIEATVARFRSIASIEFPESAGSLTEQ